MKPMVFRPHGKVVQVRVGDVVIGEILRHGRWSKKWRPDSGLALSLRMTEPGYDFAPDLQGIVKAAVIRHWTALSTVAQEVIVNNARRSQ